MPPRSTTANNPNFHRLDGPSHLGGTSTSLSLASGSTSSSHVAAVGLAPSAPIDAPMSYPNPNVQGNPYIYLAVYSSVPVYEMMIRGIGVMRRRTDSFLNATQILKVAGVDKAKRTKILEKEITLGVHEKVQGGYGRYQGTWIPFEKAVELANQFGVAHLLAPLFEYTAPPPPVSLGTSASTSEKPTAGASGESASLKGTGPLDDDAMDAEYVQESVAKKPTKKRASKSQAGDETKRAKRAGSVGATGVYAVQEHFKLKRSTKHLSDTPATIDPHTLERHKTLLKSIFSIDAPATTTPDLSATFPPDLDSDTPIDDHAHTALHWAAALARVSVVRALVQFGADMHRGNNVGETPLIRAVLVTNNSDNDAFPRLLEALGPSLRTVDDTGRTILHHAALVAGVKGRASSARYYMESVLEYVARFEKGQFKELVDAQDLHGDTALNIAARVGNKGLVRMLIEVGADKVKPNKLGLRPGDFGVEGVDLVVTAAEDVLAGIKGVTVISAPVAKSNDVITEISTLITSLSADFANEIQGQSEALERTRTQLRLATRELSEQRKQMTHWRTKGAELEEKRARIENLERALEEEDRFDWTGRSTVEGKASKEMNVGAAFAYRGPGSVLGSLPTGIPIEFDVDPPLPRSDTEAVEGDGGKTLVQVTRMEMWYTRVSHLLHERIDRLEGGNIEQEARLRKVVAKCCGVEAEQVDGMLESLLAALESDGSSLDMTRVAAFLSKVRDVA